MYILGQFFGIVGAIITIATPQLRRKEQMLLSNALVNTMSTLNFFLIGQKGSAVFLCLVAIAQCFVSIHHEKKQTDVTMGENILFFFLYVGLGFFGMVTSENFVLALTADFFLELLPIVGALMLMLSVFAKGEQKTRLYLLCNATTWAVYSAIVGATTFFTSCAAMISTVLALWKYRKLQKSAQSVD